MSKNVKKSFKWLIAAVFVFLFASVMVQGWSDKTGESTGVITQFDNNQGLIFKTQEGVLSPIPGYTNSTSEEQTFVLTKPVSINNSVLIESCKKEGYPVRLVYHNLPVWKNLLMHNGKGGMFVDSIYVLSNIKVAIPDKVLE